jgi:hypothetical protein
MSLLWEMTEENLEPMSVLTFKQTMELYTAGLLGAKEFRNLLARVNTHFQAVRDDDLDVYIEKQAELRDAALQHYQNLGQSPNSDETG